MLSLCVILLLSVGGLLASKVVYQGMVMERLHTELTYLKSEVRHVDAIDAEISDLEKRIEFLDGMLNAYIPASDILNELTIRIPESAWLKSMDFSGKTFKLRGDAQSASSLVSLLEASPMFQDAKFLSTITKTNDGRESFQIGLNLVEKMR